MTTYTLSVSIVAPGALKSDGSPSPFGHMWYSISDGNGNSTSYGFDPVVPNTPFGSGHVVGNDNSVFQTQDITTKTIQLTQSQYDTLQAFGSTAVSAAQS